MRYLVKRPSPKTAFLLCHYLHLSSTAFFAKLCGFNELEYKDISTQYLEKKQFSEIYPFV